jgi:pilus assembly protein Flp/PilA
MKLIHDTSGATAVEYGLIGAGIAIAIVAAVFALGDELVAVFGTTQEALGQSRN